MRPFWQKACDMGVVEKIVYVLGIILSAQACRAPEISPTAPSDGVVPWWAVVCGMLGGLSFAPCWSHSVTLHSNGATQAGWGRACLTMLLIGFVVQAAALVPLAIALRSSCIGFVAVFAVYLTGIVAFACGHDLLGRTNPEFVLLRCSVEASATLSLITVALALCPSLTAQFSPRPFAEGLSLFGHVSYFIALMGLSSSGWQASKETFQPRQIAAGMSFALALFVGWLADISAFRGCGVTFFLLFSLLKHLEYTTWFSIQSVSLKAVAAIIILRFLCVNSHFVTSMTDMKF